MKQRERAHRRIYRKARRLAAKRTKKIRGTLIAMIVAERETRINMEARHTEARKFPSVADVAVSSLDYVLTESRKVPRFVRWLFGCRIPGPEARDRVGSRP